MQRKIFKNALIVDVIRQVIFKGWFSVNQGRFEFVEEGEVTTNEPCQLIDLKEKYVVPGFIDAHMHVESSLVTCSSFAKAALKHGTAAVLHDPHEIANVFGADGVKFMIQDGNNQPLRFYCAIPSCVPVTRKKLETANSSIDPVDVEELSKLDRVIALGEVMDYLGVIEENEKLMKIIEVARKNKLLIEGHSPTLRGEKLSKYIAAGIGSDHTLTNPDKINEQLSKGMHVMIQEKSLSEENIKSIMNFPDRSRILLVTDDVIPTRLVKGHLNKIVSLAIKNGWKPLDAIASATIRPATYMKISDMGSISPGKIATFFTTKDITELSVENFYCEGTELSELVFKPAQFSNLPETIKIKNITTDAFKLTNVKDGKRKLNVVTMNQFNTLTGLINETVSVRDGIADGDYVNVCVFRRREESLKGHVGLLKGFGLTKGAIVSSFAHDSHNIVAVGKSIDHLKKATEELLDMKGGMVFFDGENLLKLPLEIGGVITSNEVEKVAGKLDDIEKSLRKNGVKHKNPILFLTILALTVSPEFKFSDLGIVDTENSLLMGNQ
ncbi:MULTISPECIES: adenine deaminase C-terminal domain-containing protein [Pseudothermotoga]|uniref:Adenine deaminase n=1 Tax=Pseudothermotoga lettingae (strain ATCC BAA-301 / DSM 14385 / NBRC 107922 / TMO) TaxID=416591 RepID=A8F6W7_PSELT|nr:MULTISPECIES: adenine deaminase C-terminal domain-containing protein [Pseudothermotoga]ABV33901.1 Adenine deaminase [Pseudothermotoga lettingae TMO]KUK20220.1 MAG: Adenine deaminase [Pseudothermotoga lettingae]MDK2884268.1 adenine deaminase [Pseudothermotoga sp.]GLI49162.1 adenine deaminase [Pseudothermotoga lettingae TMO]HBT25898.1 adenine deaminase [Pseudothermotoga sp.]